MGYKDLKEMTPQLATLLILTFVEKQTQHLYEIIEDPGLSQTPEEKVMLKSALDNYMSNLRSNITYQKKICG